ncbi:MAG: tetratricopeptide repeat protein [Chitinivibrionales bacterium]|nr:tetratricopeptide repeat protein [Chitinivibrionales bacterium]
MLERIFMKLSLFFFRTALCMLCAGAVRAAEISNGEAWNLLIDNKPLEAQKAFAKNTQQEENDKVAQAWRGLALTQDFLGNRHAAMQATFKSFQADNDTLLLHAMWLHALAFSRSWGGHTVSNGYDVLEHLTDAPALTNGPFYSALAQRYVNDGKIRKARALLDELHIPRTWMMIGPFDNISGSGYKKKYPPEQRLNFDTSYSGKNGATVSWFAGKNKRANAWLFTGKNYDVHNAVLYYYTSIISDARRKVKLGFGASGAFKVFVNGDVALADSIFRNTGTDVYMQEITLRRGANSLLIKLGHEDRQSNFLLRILGMQGEKPDGISFDHETVSNAQAGITYDQSMQTPLVNRVESYLRSALQKNADDIEKALLLMNYFNINELTDKGQAFAAAYVKKHPQSSILQQMYGEALVRGLKYTQSKAAQKSAYNLCELNYKAWSNELSSKMDQSSTRDVAEFIENSPPLFHDYAEALLALFAHYVETENQAEALAVAAKLEEMHLGNSTVTSVLANLYAAMGAAKKTEKMLKKLIAHYHTNTWAYNQLADIYLRMGKTPKAYKTLERCLQYNPDHPAYYFILAKLTLQNKQFDRALDYIDEALKIMPTASAYLNLKASILTSRGQKEAARQTLRRSIDYEYFNFNAWDQLYELEAKRPIDKLLVLPDLDSLIEVAQTWDDRTYEEGAIIGYVKDVYLYPSRCSRERRMLAVYLPTQKAIDNWKEYRVSINGVYQTASINKSYTRKANGKEIPADTHRGNVVFKSLEPGDCIYLSWTIANYYRGGMARHVWGEVDFSLGYPTHTQLVRLVTPHTDTIPYHIHGDAIAVSKKKVNDLIITAFSRSPYKMPPHESYSVIQPPGEDRLVYSTIADWSDIVTWYRNLTENKISETTELQRLADSLFAGVNDDFEKVARVHEYITSNIRYSYVPFRQSGWIPQSSKETLATRIGDCKDMSSLGKALLDRSGISSSLVLVNTRDGNSSRPGYIGPNFNHCILSYSIDSATGYLDLTDNNLAVGNLPWMDQGALALEITEDNDELTHLPVDDKQKRAITRSVHTRLTREGGLTSEVRAIRTNIFASRFRSNYRFKSAKEQKQNMQQSLSDDYPNAVIDSLDFDYLDTLNDTVAYYYSFSSSKAGTIAGPTVIFPIKMSEAVTGKHYPSEATRAYPIDMHRTWFAVGEFDTEGLIDIPQSWKVAGVPEDVALVNKYGEYALTFEKSAEGITYRRKAHFDFPETIEPDAYGEIREFLSDIAKADEAQVVFKR